MPQSCKGTYRRVALVKLTPEYAANGELPKMISTHARGVVAVKDRGNHSLGKTERCAYFRALRSAEAEAAELNTDSVAPTG
jgi:hypothetical protein